jgi:hypothetical protein
VQRCEGDTSCGLYAAIAVPVISHQIWHLCAMTWRYAGGEKPVASPSDVLGDRSICGKESRRVTWTRAQRDVRPRHPETAEGLQGCRHAAGPVAALDGLPPPTGPRSTHVPQGLLADRLTHDGRREANAEALSSFPRRRLRCTQRSLEHRVQTRRPSD